MMLFEISGGRCLKLTLSTLVLFGLCVSTPLAVGLGDVEPGLKSKIDAVLSSRKVPRGHVGIQVVSLTKGEELYSLNAEKSFSPASAMKLVTMGAALEHLGRDFRWKTQVWRDGSIQDGVLQGNLYVKGYGDPYFMEEDMVELALMVANASIDRISGTITYDESYFDGDQLGPGVKPNSQNLYDPRQSALSYGSNIVCATISPAWKSGGPADVTIEPASSYISLVNKARTVSTRSRLRVYKIKGSSTIVVAGRISRKSPPLERYFKMDDPGRFFASAFLDKLREAGVSCPAGVVSGKIDHDDSGFRLIGTHHSPPLMDLLWMLGKKSNNFMAEQMLKTLGAEMFDAPGSFRNGSRVLSRYVEALGQDPKTFSIVDGSGLSRDDRLSPALLMSVLRHIYSSDRLRPIYVDSLAWAGMDGTLWKRLLSPKTVGRVFGKTGSLAGVSALSGYVAARKTGDLAFVILVNGTTGRSRAKRIEDAIVRILAAE